MSNNVALDIAIGLAFTYVLYSLLATTIKEFVATLFSYRERMLERGIEQMLDGKNYSYYWWEKLYNGLLWVFHHKGECKVAEKAKLDAKQKPYDKKHLAAKVNECRSAFFSTSKEVDTKPRRKLDDKAALFASKIMNHSLYRRAAIDNKMSKKPAYLSSDTFSDILINILSDDKSSHPDAPVLMKDISRYVDHELGSFPELKNILNIYIEQSNGDLQRFKLLIENWYDDTMDRVSGWYKRQANRILFMIGLFLALMFNVNTIRIVSSLSVNEAERNAIVAQATDYIKSNLNGPAKAGTGNDSAHLKAISDAYKNTRSGADSIVAFGWGKFGGSTTWYGKVGYVLENTFCIWEKTTDGTQLLGFLLTAFAISLGAPFWFDLLNKFINLRVSGAKPESSPKAGGGSKTPGLNQSNTTPDPKAFA